MNNIIFAQFHNYLINGKYEKDIASEYYNGIYKYKKNQGYYKTEHFFELPLWINEIVGSLKNTDYKKELLIIEDIEKAIKNIELKNPEYILFSVLEVNKKFVQRIIEKTKFDGVFILGGYIDFKPFKKYKNVKIYNSVQEFINTLNIKYKYNLDYSLFKNYPTVPRLTLSKGCKYRCKFCIIENNVTELNTRDILKQVKSFKPLKFKLVYLNDKTFGQASNYKLLPLIYKRIKKYNKDFKGFIIQTNSSLFLKSEFIEVLKDSHIFACELGIESYNNHILRSLHKPQNIDIIETSIEVLKSLHIKIIPNLIIGLIGENRQSYNNTLKFIKKHIKNIFLLNIYNLAIYQTSALANEINIKNDDDLNENVTKKSFYNATQLEDNDYFYNSIFKLGMDILKQN